MPWDEISCQKLKARKLGSEATLAGSIPCCSSFPACVSALTSQGGAGTFCLLFVLFSLCGFLSRAANTGEAVRRAAARIRGGAGTYHSGRGMVEKVRTSCFSGPPSAGACRQMTAPMLPHWSLEEWAVCTVARGRPSWPDQWIEVQMTFMSLVASFRLTRDRVRGRGRQGCPVQAGSIA